MAWFKRESGDLENSGEKRVKTEGLWVKCEGCRQIIWKKDLEENLNVCPKCEKHFRIDARTRLAQLLDNGEYEVFDADIASTDPLRFVDLKPYSSRLRQAQADTDCLPFRCDPANTACYTSCTLNLQCVQGGGRSCVRGVCQ